MQRAVGELTKTSLGRMEREMPWFGELPAEHRAWIGSVLQAGFNSFVTWYRHPMQSARPLTVEVFGSAPRSFAGVITLQQTVAMIRLTIEVAEADLSHAVDPEHAVEVRESILHYGRELAFATADIYAHAAEMRGAWDARLEALVVDSIMRGEADETVRTRASALGWVETGNVAVVVGRAPDAGNSASREGFVDDVRDIARHAGMDALGAVQGDRLVVVVGGVSDADKAGALLTPHFGDGPVVVGPVVPDLLQAHVSAAEAVAGLRAAAGWPGAPGATTSDDLLAERALDGDLLARRDLIVDVYKPLLLAGSEVLETLTGFLDQAGSIEGTARALFVHPNTVRYRLKRVVDLTGLSPGNARHAFTLRIAIVLGRLETSQAAPETSL
jgi:hypothetical protein